MREYQPWLSAGEVVVKVFDDMWSGVQPRGKQSPDDSGGCIYTRTTGIWQSVWLEAVDASFIENLSVVPDPDNARVLIEAKINGADKDLTLKAEAFADGKLSGSDAGKGPWQNTLVINFKDKKLWEPGSPFLSDLKLKLTAPASGKTITYLTDKKWDPKTLLYGKNWLAALAFCEVPLETTKPNP